MSSDPHLDAGGIVQRQFTTARRGYDAEEVRAYLHELASAMGALQRSEAELRERAESAEARARKAEQLDEHRLVEILGEETARVLDAARAASTDIRGKAEESASRLISEANQEAHRVQAEAEAALATQRSELLAEVEKLRADAASELDRRRAEGAEVVAQMRREAQAECDSLRQVGEQKRLEAEMQAETIRAKAREEGRALIAEAQVVRERVLGDLARRRRTAREQLERLNAARERLLAAYEVVRRTVDEATGELTVVLPEAKIAGDSAVRRVQGEPEPSVEQLEDMVAMARITGLLEDAASQGFDDEDYLADDAPPPVVAAGGATGEDAAPGEPVELYDVESEGELADVYEAEESGEPEVEESGESHESDVEVAPAEVDEREPGVLVASVAPGDDEEPAAMIGDGPGVWDEPTVVEEGGRADPALVNGHARPVTTGVVVAAAAEGDGVLDPASSAAVALAPEPPPPSPAEAGVVGTPMGPATGLDGPTSSDAVDDRRVNGHTHPAVEVGGDDAEAGDADHDGEDDLGVERWPDEDDEDAVDVGSDRHSTSNVDELFARLRAGRATESEAGTAGAADPDAEHDGDGLDGDAGHAEHDDGVAAPTRRSVSALAAMSDADILASAGYGDADDDGHGGYEPGEGDDFADDEHDDYGTYGLAVTQPDPATLVDGLEGLDDGGLGEGGDAGEPDFADMDPDEAMLRLRDDSLETVEHDLSRRLKRVLADEQNEVLDTLRRHKPASFDELLPGGGEAHVARYADAAVEGLSTAAAWGAASVEGEPAGSYDALAGELGRTVVEPLRERIVRSFAEAGGDVDDLTGRLRALYREWKSHHLGAAVQHYAAAAYARGAYEAVPDGTPVRWLVDRTSDACPDADDNALAGSVCKGEAFPTGGHCPPAHPGCRCMVVPLDWPRLG